MTLKCPKIDPVLLVDIVHVLHKLHFLPRDAMHSAVLVIVNLTVCLSAVTPGNIMVKYADDTYLVIPACNSDSGEREINNIEAWSRVNLT